MANEVKWAERGGPLYPKFTALPLHCCTTVFSNFQGTDCSYDVDECIWEPGVCEHKDNTVCRNLYGFYTCDCQPGYTGSSCEIITTTKPTMTDEQSVSPSSSSVSSYLIS